MISILTIVLTIPKRKESKDMLPELVCKQCGKECSEEETIQCPFLQNMTGVIPVQKPQRISSTFLSKGDLYKNKRKTKFLPQYQMELPSDIASFFKKYEIKITSNIRKVVIDEIKKKAETSISIFKTDGEVNKFKISGFCQERIVCYFKNGILRKFTRKKLLQNKLVKIKFR